MLLELLLLMLLELCNDRRGEQRSITYIDQTRLNMQFTFPLNEVATDFYDELKSRSSGYASFDYEDAGFRTSDLGNTNDEKYFLKCMVFSRFVYSQNRHFEELRPQLLVSDNVGQPLVSNIV